MARFSLPWWVSDLLFVAAVVALLMLALSYAVP